MDRLVSHVHAKVNQDSTFLNSLSWISIALVSAAFVFLCTLIYRLQNGTEKMVSANHIKLEEEAKRIKSISCFIEGVSAGNYSTQLEKLTETDELAPILLALRDKLSLTNESDRRRNWSSNGLAQIGDVLRASNISVTVLYDTIIRFVVKYTESNQGGLFIYKQEDEQTKYLELAACYAFERKKFLKRKVEIGEGLAGQCFIEGEKIYLLDVPKEYVTITSGLGGANPSALLLVPMKVNDKMYGVIELASFKKYEDFEIELIEKLAESIAATISTVRTNESTRVLLEKTQQQTEELRAQEEEVRQNMEELSATQEEMERKGSEMEARIRAINESGVATIEFDPKGYILSANDSFLNLMGYAQSEVVGKHHRMFVDSEYANTQEYKKFWDDLGNGISKPGEYVRVTKAGSKVYIKGTYSIITDQTGKVIRILKLVTDITSIKLQMSKSAEQEEELRQNLEEMSTTQEEMLRRSSEMESRITAINESGVATIEFDPKGFIVSANESFLNLMGYTQNEVEGRHHNMFVEPAFKSTEEYKKFWEDLGNGISKPGEYTRVTKSGSKVHIKGSYSIITDQAGKVMKILKLVTDVTDFKKQVVKFAKLEESMREKEQEYLTKLNGEKSILVGKRSIQ
jgi:methyl-accepting chemotaxis protein